MAGAAINLPDVPEKWRAFVMNWLAGLFFGIAWWIVIDQINYSHLDPNPRVVMTPAYYVPGICSTIGLFMVNIVNWKFWDGLAHDGSTTSKPKCYVLSAFFLMFTAEFVSMFILSNYFKAPDGSKLGLDGESWPGIYLVLQNALIPLSCALFRAGRNYSHQKNAYQRQMM
eukprot:TRINITY_DN30166_c0_g1_i1.p1 TRINITY_DN30166_c0_g1~~TRINITY_DN30166_c0_g1_i1.p1  ORF type:complete len:179 (+),score=42.41 TRINITY_DN30166_c0_g1_i1:30-539(+)